MIEVLWRPIFVAVAAALYIVYEVWVVSLPAILWSRGWKRLARFLSRSRLPDRAEEHPSAALWVMGAMIIAALGPAAMVVEAFIEDSPHASEYLEAGRWINENIPPGSTIGILMPMPHLYNDPPFMFGRYRLRTIATPRDLHFHDTSIMQIPDGEEWPEYAVFTFYCGTWAYGDMLPLHRRILKAGYRPIKGFGSYPCKSMLNNASPPTVIYRRMGQEKP